jgi:hypothetical protein
VVPLSIWEQLPPDVQANPDSATMAPLVTQALNDQGRRLARAARLWPQELGFRVVKRLAERGRVAFVLVHETNREALGWAMQKGVRDRNRSRLHRVDGRLERRHIHRVEPDVFAAVVARAGHDWRRGPKSPPCGCQICGTASATECDGSRACSGCARRRA